MRTRLSDSRRTWITAAAIVLAMTGLPAGAQEDYPNKPIRLILPTTGGTTEVLARLVGARLSEVFKKQIVVDSRPGAAGVIAGEITAKAQPDGYTLILTFTQHTVNAALNRRLPYHPINDFTPITQLTAAGLILVVNPSTPVNDLKEFVAWTKHYKGALNFGSGGSGSGGHLAGELYNLMAGVKAQHIPYKGPAPALTDLLGGQFHYMFAGLQSSQSLVRAGKLRSLAVTTRKRIAVLPDLPAVAEVLPGFEIVGWYGVMGPAKLPKPIVERLHDELVRIIQQPDMRERIIAAGSEPIGSSPDEFRKFLQGELAKWAKLVQDRGLKFD